jgi:hypothetical protein
VFLMLFIDYRNLTPRQLNRWLFKQSLFELFSSGAGRQPWRIVSTVVLINRTALVTVQPSTIGAKGD